MTPIRFEPSECGPGCHVPDCPYMHGDSWFVGVVSFQTEREAREYAQKIEAREAVEDKQLADGTHYLDANGSLQPKPTA